MRKSLVLQFSLVLTILAFAGAAEAAPTSEIALERYRTALAERKIDLDRQGISFETLDGRPLLSYNVDCLFNPASVVKLATSYQALDKLGPNHRFATLVFTNGGLDASTGQLHGDLLVLGSGDPSLTTENAFLIARELRSRGIRIVKGNLIVKGPLHLNYSMNRLVAGKVIKNALNVELWNGQIEAAFGRYRVQSGQASFESVTIEGDVIVDDSIGVGGMTPLFSLRSMPLFKILKQLNNYSNNWVAHVVGGFVGGPRTVERETRQRYRILAEDLFLQTTSGLGRNGMRPSDAVLLLRDLSARLQTNELLPEHVMPVAGRDPGTLERRFLSPGYNGAVVAKTGTLRGVSSLAGYMYTRKYGIVVFAILNEGGTPATFRRLQDYLVSEMFEVCGGPAPRSYRRPFAYGDTAGAFIERALGNIPEAAPEYVEAGN